MEKNENIHDNILDIFLGISVKPEIGDKKFWSHF